MGNVSWLSNSHAINAAVDVNNVGKQLRQSRYAGSKCSQKPVYQQHLKLCYQNTNIKD